MSITVSHLTKTYGIQRAVDDISFEINKGEVVGFLGPNGAGKSTTMKIITGYLEANSGKVDVGGVRVIVNDNETKKKIGYLPEANPLYQDMYVREYLGFVADVHQIQQSKSAIEEVIVTVGLTKEANKKIGQLSKGYKQRVGLAAALIHDPEVLILDEPTSGLDPNQIIEIRELIKKLGKNKTVLFCSHILQEVQAICDRIIIIHKGKIVADDNLLHLQSGSTGKQIVIVAFKEQVPIDLLSSLKNISTIAQLAHINTVGGTQPGFQISTYDPDGLRKQLMELSLQNNLNIVSLQSDNNSLEEIFRVLTTNTN